MSIYNDVNEIERMYFEADTVEDQGAALALLEEILNVGLEKLAYVRANKEARITALKNEEQRLNARRKAEEKRLEQVENYMMQLLHKCGGRAEVGSFSLSIRKSKRVEITDDNLLPAEYKVTKITYSPDKKKIKDDIENNGVIIDGANVVEFDNLQVK